MRSLRISCTALLRQALAWVLSIWVFYGNGPGAALLAQTGEQIRGFVSEGYCWIGFPTVASQIYFIEYSTNLTSWELLVGNLIGTGSDALILDPEPVAEQSARFYRTGRFSGAIPGEPLGNPDPDLWAWVSPSSFTQGSPTNEPDRESDEGPPVMVVLSKGLWMGRHEVTQGEYQALMGGNPSWFVGDPNRPVENVSWGEATNYCARLTAQEQAAGRLPAGYVYRLPTEAEWENACRAGSATAYSYGSDEFGVELGFYAWHWDNSGSTNAPAEFAFFVGGKYYTTHPASALQPNRWGLYDMYGNVWEWCWDWYQSSYPTYPDGTVQDPTGPVSGVDRVMRGGSWNSGPASCRSANRSAGSPGGRSSGIGFRIVLASPL